MQLISVLTVAAGLLTLGAASPTSKRAQFPEFIKVSADQVKSHTTPQSSAAVAEVNVQTVGVYVCTDAYGQGNCAYVLNIPGACSKLASTDKKRKPLTDCFPTRTASLTGTAFNDQISFVDPSGNSNTPNATCTVFM